jgi:small-conductance mechanosensitive channel
LVTETLLSATKNVTEILKTPEPDILFVWFGDSALQFQVRVRVNVKKHPLAIIKSKLCYAIRDALKVNNIEIPFPQQDVWFKNKIPLK